MKTHGPVHELVVEELLGGRAELRVQIVRRRAIHRGRCVGVQRHRLRWSRGCTLDLARWDAEVGCGVGVGAEEGTRRVCRRGAVPSERASTQPEPQLGLARSPGRGNGVGAVLPAPWEGSIVPRLAGAIREVELSRPCGRSGGEGSVGVSRGHLAWGSIGLLSSRSSKCSEAKIARRFSHWCDLPYWL